MRPSCLNCCRKHLAQAIVLLTESKLGYGETYSWLAVGHLAEAETETVQQFPKLANAIRAERLKLMEDQDYSPKLIDLIEWASGLAAEMEAENGSTNEESPQPRGKAVRGGKRRKADKES